MRRARIAVLPALAAAVIATSCPSAAENRFAVHAAHLIDGRAPAARGPVWVIVSGDTVLLHST